MNQLVTWIQNRDIDAQPSILCLFYAHLDADKIPTQSTAQTFTVLELAKISLEGLLSVAIVALGSEGDLEPILLSLTRSWPVIFEWIEFLYSLTTPGAPAHEFPLPSDFGLAINSTISTLLRILSIPRFSPLSHVIDSTPALKILCELWFTDSKIDVFDMDATSFDSALSLSAFIGADPARVPQFIQAFKGNRHRIGSTLLRHAGMYLHCTPPRCDLFQASIDVIGRVSSGDQELNSVLLSLNSVAQITTALKLLTLRGPSAEVAAAAGLCIRYLTMALHKSDSKWVAQTVGAGILAALLESSQWTLPGECEDIRMHLITYILPLYLIYRPVLRAVDRSLADVDTDLQELESALPDGKFRTSWLAFKSSARERLKIKADYDAQIKYARVQCGSDEVCSYFLMQLQTTEILAV